MKEWFISYWAQVFCGGILTGLGIWFKKFRAYKRGIRATLRHDLIQEYEKYKARDCIPIYGMDSVLEMYEAYHALGGNGAITKLVDELKALPSPCPGDVK